MHCLFIYVCETQKIIVIALVHVIEVEFLSIRLHIPLTSVFSANCNWKSGLIVNSHCGNFGIGVCLSIFTTWTIINNIWRTCNFPKRSFVFTFSVCASQVYYYYYIDVCFRWDHTEVVNFLPMRRVGPVVEENKIEQLLLFHFCPLPSSTSIKRNLVEGRSREKKQNNENIKKRKKKFRWKVSFFVCLIIAWSRPTLVISPCDWDHHW